MANGVTFLLVKMERWFELIFLSKTKASIFAEVGNMHLVHACSFTGCHSSIRGNMKYRRHVELHQGERDMALPQFVLLNPTTPRWWYLSKCLKIQSQDLGKPLGSKLTLRLAEGSGQKGEGILRRIELIQCVVSFRFGPSGF